MENSIHLASERYNEIGQFLNLPNGNLFTEIKKQTKPFQLNYISKKRKQEIVRCKFKMYQIYYNQNIVCLIKEHKFKVKEAELIITDLRTPVELLKSRIVDHGISPTYRLVSKNEPGQKSTFQYSCSLFGLYGK